MKQGVLHIHSTYSYDGYNTIEEIAEWAKGEDLDFVILTEHDNDFNEEKFNRYRADCERNSRDLKIFPGIEYSFGVKRHIHINVFGIQEFIETGNNPEDISPFLKKVKTMGGFSVLNHPKGILKEISELDLTHLDGIELWNTKNDFHYAPDPRVVRFISSHYKDKWVLATSDIHRLPMGAYAKVVLKSDFGSVRELTGNLKQGAYHCTFGSRRIPSKIRSFRWNPGLLWAAGKHEQAYQIIRKSSRALGIKAPPQLVKRLKLKQDGV